MGELSTEVKAKETREKAVGYFKVSEQYGYKFIMEIKKMRDERYYRELGYSNFNDYCKDAWGVGRRVIDESIQSASSLPENYFESFNSRFGHRKTFLLATMTSEHREKIFDEGIPTERGNKPIDEATQQEINEYRRKLRESEQSKAEVEERVRQLENQPPQVVEKEVVKEVVPEDYDLIKGNYSALESRTEHYKEQNEELRAELKRLENLLNDSDMDEQEKDRKRLEIEADINVLELKIKVDRFLKEVAITSFMKGAIAASGKSKKDKLYQSVEMIKDFAKQMDMALEGRIEI